MLTSNQVIHGDCTTILCSLPSASTDLIVTDPPYLVGYKDRQGRSIANDRDATVIEAAFEELYRVLKPDSFCVSFYGWPAMATFANAWQSAGFRPVGHLVWTKSYTSRRGYFLNGRHEQAFLLAKGRPARLANTLDDVLPWEYSGNRFHPTEKAVSVMQPLVRSLSKPGDFPRSLRRFRLHTRRRRALRTQLPRHRL